MTRAELIEQLQRDLDQFVAERDGLETDGWRHRHDDDRTPTTLTEEDDDHGR